MVRKSLLKFIPERRSADVSPFLPAGRVRLRVDFFSVRTKVSEEVVMKKVNEHTFDQCHSLRRVHGTE